MAIEDALAGPSRDEEPRLRRGQDEGGPKGVLGQPIEGGPFPPAQEEELAAGEAADEGEQEQEGGSRQRGGDQPPNQAGTPPCRHRLEPRLGQEGQGDVEPQDQPPLEGEGGVEEQGRHAHPGQEEEIAVAAAAGCPDRTQERRGQQEAVPHQVGPDRGGGGEVLGVPSGQRRVGPHHPGVVEEDRCGGEAGQEERPRLGPERRPDGVALLPIPQPPQPQKGPQDQEEGGDGEGLDEG